MTGIVESPESGATSRAPGLFPIFLKLDGRPCLVVGAGKVAESKIEGLIASGATLRVVAPEATEQVAEWARARRLSWEQRAFESGDLEGIFLAVVATSIRDLNERVFQECRERGVLCNVVDDPPHCDFYYPAVVRRGDLQIAISTNGRSPALAQRLRRELEQQFGPEYDAWVEELGIAREKVFQQSVDPETRRNELHRLASAEAYEQFVRENASALTKQMKGKQYAR